MLWALGQPAAVAGLAAAFALAVGLRVQAQHWCARWAGAVPAPTGRVGLDPIGVITAVVAGTGWGRETFKPTGPRAAAVILAGPLTVIAASQLVLYCYRAEYPQDALTLKLYRPSDVLHGALAPTAAAQLMLSVGVGLLCFGLLALVPLPPLDGYRLLFGGSAPTNGERLGVVAVLVLMTVPVQGRPPLVTLLDMVGMPLVRLWA